MERPMVLTFQPPKELLQIPLQLCPQLKTTNCWLQMATLLLRIWSQTLFYKCSRVKSTQASKWWMSRCPLRMRFSTNSHKYWAVFSLFSWFWSLWVPFILLCTASFSRNRTVLRSLWGWWEWRTCLTGWAGLHSTPSKRQSSLLSDGSPSALMCLKMAAQVIFSSTCGCLECPASDKSSSSNRFSRGQNTLV